MQSTLTLGQQDNLNVYRMTKVLFKLGFKFDVNDELYDILSSASTYVLIPELL